MRIGSVAIPQGAGLAPMAGVTELPFRLLCRELGCAYSVSEMLSAKGFLYAPRPTWAVRQLYLSAPQQGVCGLQLFGREPELMAEAANQLSDAGFQFIDINMGCPAHKIVANGEGSALMREEALAARIVEAVCRATPLPVTVKLRAGWDEAHKNAPQLARRLAGSGAAAITVHGRTREQFYAGRADWAVIAAVKRAAGIPVVGNGDVTGGADALRMINETGCDGVMVGRAAQGNPWVFREIAAALRGDEAPAPTRAERARMALRHADMMAALKGEGAAVREMRKHVHWYLHGFRGAGQLREAVNRAQSMDRLRALLLEGEGER